AFRRLGAGVLEAWARAALALVLRRAGAPEARDAALAAEALARSAGARGPQALAFLALEGNGHADRAEYRRLAAELAAECGLLLPADARPGGPAAVPDEEPKAALRVRCFGAFGMTVGSTRVDLAAV